MLSPAAWSAFSAAISTCETHAFFKGLLFLAAGSVIHAVNGEQDMRQWRAANQGFRDVLDHDDRPLRLPAFRHLPDLSKDENSCGKPNQANWSTGRSGLFTAF